ncbi:glycosyltransferase [Marinobacter sp.]|uniref:glycosyltransferase n=1 Tax=Marinobacter sp. TaxID=50741 RepID=UPI003BAD6CAF
MPGKKSGRFVVRLRTRFAYLKWHVKDYVVFPLRSYLSSVLALGSYLLKTVGVRDNGLVLLMKADRVGPSRLSRVLVRLWFEDLVEVSRRVVLKEANASPEWIEKRSIVLKDPVIDETGGVLEKGVYLIKFTTTFPDAFARFNLERLLEYFHIVLEPSWAGYCLPEILSWSSLSAPIIVEASECEDRSLLESLDTNLVPVEFGSGDWVDPDVFRPIEAVEKEYDVIYVANFNSIKRQYVFLKALRDLDRQGVTLKAALVCGRWGECREEILDLIRDFQLSDKITFYEGLSQPELNVLLNKSKVNILLSLKEGSNRSLFEGFFAGTPGILLSNNIGVNKEYFNSQTGVTITESDLPKTLIFFSQNWDSFSPREWAIENISPVKTTEKLENVLKRFDPDYGRFTSQPEKLFIKVNSPEATLWSQGGKKPCWDVGKIHSMCGGDQKKGA